MEVRVVVVLVVAVVWSQCGVRAKEAVEVKREVEKIFKTVEEIMAGRSSQVKRTLKTSTQPGLAASEGRARIEKPETTPEVEKPIDRSFVKPTTSFPVGVIMSDNLYPLVVGKNADTGQPFVMNLDKQHAMVVARSSGDGGYRLVIPFPVMLGSQRFGDYEEEEPAFPVYRSARPVTPVSGYGGYQAGYPSSPEGRTTGSYQEEPSSVETPARLHSKYAQSVPHQEDSPYQEEPRHVKYHQKLPKKYLRPVPTSGFARHKPIDSLDSYPTDPHSKFRPTYLTNPEKQLSYYVEGPKYVPIAKKIIPVAYRQPSSSDLGLYSPASAYPFLGPPRRVIQYRNYYNDAPSSAYPVSRYPSTYRGAPKDFRPSPYLGSITESRDSSENLRYKEEVSAEATTLQPQSEMFETYDDRGDEMITEKDFDDASSEKPEGRHSSSGGVRHVTHHVDDYLGKIYEEMYYRLPSTERIDTDSSSTSGTLDSRAPQIFPVQDYQKESALSGTEATERRSNQASPPPQTEPARSRSGTSGQQRRLAAPTADSDHSL